MRALTNKRGQGTTEYIVIIAIAVGIAIAVVWTPLKDQLKTAVGTIGQKVNTQAQATN